jgi:hypothetical protein
MRQCHPLPSFLHTALWTEPPSSFLSPLRYQNLLPPPSPNFVLRATLTTLGHSTPPSHFPISYCPTLSTGSPSHCRNGAGLSPPCPTSVRSTSRAPLSSLLRMDYRLTSLPVFPSYMSFLDLLPATVRPLPQSNTTGFSLNHRLIVVRPTR